MRKLLFLVLLVSLASQPLFAQGAFSPDQYRKALWMITRFYGGQRDGIGPNWLLMDHTYTTSFLKDGDTEGIDLTGGWFDCGDHVTFGQTFFFSAYMLAKAYDVFPTGFHDDYHGFDYKDYAESAKTNSSCKDWNMTCGESDGIPDLLQELKYATDWIIKATPNASTFYYQKGRAKTNGGDHDRWETSAFKANTLNRIDGGEVDVSRPMYKEEAGGDVSSLAAAALATMSRIYRKYNAEYADTCLAHAKLAYQYAQANSTKGTNDIERCCYNTAYDESKLKVALHIASAEMYKATNEQIYYDNMVKDKINRNHVLDYANPHVLAAHLSATVLTEDRNEHIEQLHAQFVDWTLKDTSTVDDKSHSKGIVKSGNEWGAVRYLGNSAFLAALYADIVDTDTLDHFIYKQVDFILGSNRRNYSFLVGFDDHGGEMAKKPHHRNVYLNDENWPANERDANLTIPERNKYFGYIVGGHRSPDEYKDNMDLYEHTEGGIDYNAGMLGALAYIVSKRAAADTSKMSPILSRPKTTPLKTSTIRFAGTYEFPAQNKSFTVQVYDLKGNVVSVIKSQGQAVKFVPQTFGVYFARVI